MENDRNGLGAGGTETTGSDPVQTQQPDRLSGLQQNLALLAQRVDLVVAAATERTEQARLERGRLVDRATALEARLATVEAALGPLIAHAQHSQQEEQEWSRAVKMAVLSAVLTVIVLSVLVPLLKRLAFG